MNPAALVFLLLSIGLGFLVFWVTQRAGWHWALALAVAAIPLTFTFFLGVIGLLVGALFAAAMYKLCG
jgi:hypothetical protein